MLIIELRRTFEPEDAGDNDCGLRGQRFEAGGVVASILDYDLGAACPAYLAHLNQRAPEAFPSVAALKEARRRYPEPVYASIEEVMRLEQADDPSLHEAYRASWLARGA